MKITLGREKRSGKHITLDTEKLVNNNILLIGESGSGKTHSARNIARAFSNQGATVYIYDVHGDILPGHPEVSTVTISETSPMGLQPFVINQDAEFGGVNRAISRFISTVNSSKRQLGPRQASALGRLLKELYAANGFYAGDKKTWSLSHDPRYKPRFPKKYPTFEDLLRFTKSKRKEIFTGMGSRQVKRLEDFLRKSATLSKKRVSTKYDEDEVQAAREAALESYEEFLSDAKDEKVLDSLLDFASKDVISSVFDQIEGLYSSGVFKNELPVFDMSKRIHRYDLSALEVDDQKIFIELSLSELFLKSKQSGIKKIPDTYVFIDEVKNYIIEGGMIPRYFTEIRKFGVGIIVGAQSTEQLNNDMISNAATKIILGVDRMFSKTMANKLQIEQSVIDNIIPKKSALIAMKTGEHQSGFMQVMLGE